MIIFLLASPAAASDLKVVANSDVKVSQISPEELRRVFLATQTSLGGGQVTPVLLKSGSAYGAFVKEYIDKTTAGLENYYRSLVFTGRGAMPKMFGSDAEVLAYVKRTSGAIGFVNATADTEGVKLLQVK